MKKDYKYNYALVLYDIADQESEKKGKNRVAKVFKICKKYFHHHQKSVFRGEITPANLIKLKSELRQVVDKELDFISIIKLPSRHYYEEEVIGTDHNQTESIFI